MKVNINCGDYDSPGPCTTRLSYQPQLLKIQDSRMRIYSGIVSVFTLVQVLLLLGGARGYKNLLCSTLGIKKYGYIHLKLSKGISELEAISAKVNTGNLL